MIKSLVGKIWGLYNSFLWLGLMIMTCVFFLQTYSITKSWCRLMCVKSVMYYHIIFKLALIFAHVFTYMTYWAEETTCIKWCRLFMSWIGKVNHIVSGKLCTYYLWQLYKSYIFIFVFSVIHKNDLI